MSGAVPWLSVALLSLVGACDIVGPRACTTDFRYGIAIEAWDAKTGVSVSEGLQGVTIRGSESKAMETFGNTLLGAGEEAGTFSVVVTAPGYDLWTRGGIRVTEDECHVRTVELRAELTRTVAPSRGAPYTHDRLD